MIAVAHQSKQQQKKNNIYMEKIKENKESQKRCKSEIFKVTDRLFIKRYSLRSREPFNYANNKEKN